jgi:dTDP-4-amino-4,6-dideoxygalactose transaminase
MTDHESAEQASGKVWPVTSERLDIPFIDLAAQRARLGQRIDEALARVLQHGRFILGPEVGEVEAALRTFTGAKHAIGCANGTDALVLALMALEIGRGDAVIVPSFTFSASAEAVVLAGATPVFVDVLEDTFNIDPAGLVAGLEVARAAGLKPRAVMTVDLFGQPADYDQIVGFCGAEGLFLIADAAQSMGGSYAGSRVGTLGTITTTSFFPSKPLACYGDGGALFTEDAETDALLRSLRVHGQGRNKYDNVRIGMNSRLDSLQAAVLIEKLAIFEEELELRQLVADRYKAGLADLADRVIPPTIIGDATSAWALYTVRIRDDRRDAVQGALADVGIPSVVYYPKPLHRQPAYAECPQARDLGVAESLGGEVLSLPMHPYLDAEVQNVVVESVRRAL